MNTRSRATNDVDLRAATAELSRRADRSARAPGGASLRTRVQIRLHRRRLDRELASGADPNAEALRYQRARELVDEQTRMRIAASLEGLLSEATSGPRGFSSRAPVARVAIRDSRASLDTVLERLNTAAYISAQGVAMISLLLCDAASPLYGDNHTHRKELRQALEIVVEALDHGPVLVG